jgi:asparagine synthase (glutamine-hydrolysing)
MMTDFVFVAATGSAPVPPTLVHECARALGRAREERVVVYQDATACCLVRRGSQEESVTAHADEWFAAGHVRLDRDTGLGVSDRSDLSDLALAVTRVRLDRLDQLSQLVGEYGFCGWHGASRTMFLCRDALGVKPLFYRLQGSVILAASRAALIAVGEALDDTYVGDLLVSGYHFDSHSIFSDVRRVEPGTCVVVRDGRTTVTRFWDPHTFVPASRVSAPDAIAEFRELFFKAVQWCIDPDQPTWAQLSGGLDSSSIVSAAQWLAGQNTGTAGVAGTVTYVDTIAGGDERPFADEVIAKYPVHNEQLVDCWLWQDDGEEPPFIDDPTPFYPFYARDRRAARLLWKDGARVLLSGLGSDHYLIGNRYFVADLMAHGRVLDAARAVTERAIARRQSFWRLFYGEAIAPLKPRFARKREFMRRNRMPAWLGPKVPCLDDLWSAHPALRPLAAPYGQQYAAVVADFVGVLHTQTDGLLRHEGLQVRYPFMHQPLLEYAMQLPPSLRTRPLQNKWVLREAMSGIVPEGVRTRDGKGSIGARVRWSFAREHRLLDWLLRDPIAGDLGYIATDAVRKALARALEGRVRNTDALVHALAFETWLRVRAGRWPSSDQLERLVS